MAHQTAGQAARELAQLLGADNTDPRTMLAAAKKLRADFKAAAESAHAWRAKAVSVQASFSLGATGTVDGVKIFSREEAQEHLQFGTLTNNPVAKQRAAATELATGKSLADALRAGLLR